MRPRISIRGYVRWSVRPLVRPLVRPSVGPSVGNAFVKMAENGIMQDEGASRAVYPALLLFFSPRKTMKVREEVKIVRSSVLRETE